MATVTILHSELRPEPAHPLRPADIDLTRLFENNLNLEMSLKLAHAHATLDLLLTVAISKDGANIESLCVNTLVDTLDGVMREIATVREYIDGEDSASAARSENSTSAPEEMQS
jgi:hypothetical protein